MKMQMRTRPVEWIEKRVLAILSKVKNNRHPIYLSLCARVLDFEVQTLQEQKNFDIALQNLLRRELVLQEQDNKGFKVFKLAAKI